MHNFIRRSAIAAALLLAGCNTVPSTSIRQPLTARPAAPAAVPANGAIFQAGVSERPLFEDRRARNVGDTLLINIAEAVNTADNSASSSSQAGTFSASTPTLTGGRNANTLLSPFTLSNNSTGSAASKGQTTGSNTFTGTLSATVIEVLPNGNLVVSGEKQVAISTTEEYIRFSGVVNPLNITGSNTVLSTQVADVHIEYKGASNVDKAAILSMLQRVFLSVMPFN